MSNLNDIFKHSHCLSQTQLLSYIDQTLDQEEIQAVESHINDCAMCSDAVDGLFETNPIETAKHIHDVQIDVEKKYQRYQATHLPLQVKEKITLTAQKSNRYKWLAAASVLFIIGLGGYSVFSYITSQKREIATNTTSNSSSSDKVEYNKPIQPQPSEIVNLSVNPNDVVKHNIAEKNEPIKPQKKEIIKSTTPIFNNTLAKNDTKKTEIAEPKANEIAMVAKTNSEADQSAYDQVARVEASKPNIASIEPESKYEEATPAAAVSSKIVVASSSVGKMKKSVSSQGAMPSQSNMSYPKQQNNYLDDTEILHNSIESSPKKYSREFEKGFGLFKSGEYVKSIALFENALKNNSVANKEDMQYYLASAYAKIGQDSKAEPLWEILLTNERFKTTAESELIKIKSAIKK
jgi:hypothetical protein